MGTRGRPKTYEPSLEEIRDNGQARALTTRNIAEYQICPKCGNRVLRHEPAARSCLLCGWIIYDLMSRNFSRQLSEYKNLKSSISGFMK